MKNKLPLIVLGLCLVCPSVFGASATITVKGGKLMAKGGKIVATVPAAPVPPEPVAWTDTNSYVAYYDFETLTNGYWHDSSSNSADMSNVNGVQQLESTNTNGRIEDVMLLNGGNAYAQIAPPWNVTTGQVWTCGGWFWWNGDTSRKRAFWSHARYVWGLFTPSGSTTLGCYIGGIDASWNAAMPSSNWVHIVMTRTNGAADIYLLFTNGVQVSTVITQSTLATYPTVSSRVGNGVGDTTRWFDGKVDEFFWINRSFTAADCQLHMSNTPPVLNLPGCYSGGNIRVRGTP